MATISASAEDDTLEPNKAERVFRASNGDLIVVWSERTPPIMRRAVSTDGGLTWARKDPTSLTFNQQVAGEPLNFMMCSNGDTLYGFNFNYATSTSSQMFKFKYQSATHTFIDFIMPYTFGTTPTTNKSTEDGEAVFDTIKSCVHVVFSAINAGPGTFWLIAFDFALNKKAEQTFVASPDAFPSVRVDRAASPKLYLGYRSVNDIRFRSYTFNGAAYAAADIEEVVVTDALNPMDGCAIALDAAGLVDFFWLDAAMLQTRKRTGVATYSAITTLATDVASSTRSLPGIAHNEALAIAETQNVNADVWVFYKSVVTYDTGEIYYIRRNNAVWGTATLLTGGSAGGRNGPCPMRVIPDDGYIHLVYGVGNDNTSASLWSLVYTKLPTGRPSPVT